MTRVKICGITSVEDALWAAESGADAIGLIFAESPRKIGIEKAREIAAALPPFITPVGLFVDAPLEDVRRVAADVGLDAVQIHGDFPPQSALALRGAGVKVIRAVSVASRADIEPIRDYPADAFLLDTKVEGLHGGTGKTFDWSIAEEAKKLGRIILAGGLGPDNVAEAIRRVRPYAVDASSRLESSPGKKDRAVVRRFIEAARSAGVDT